MSRLKVASLFCGCGGTDIGLEGDFEFLGKKYSENNIDVVYANDIDEKIADIFDQNFAVKVDRRDIRKVKSSEIPEHDILTFGAPCQSFSILAQNPPRLGFKDDKGKLFLEAVRILKYHQPKFFVFENVKGILSANRGQVFPLILEKFEEAGYQISYKLINSRYFGVPQKRERVFVVGVRKNLKKKFEFPENILKENEAVPLKKVLEKSIAEKYYFSNKAVEGMLRANKAKSAMNKGRAQSLNEPCNTVTAHLSKVTLNGTDPVLLEKDRFRRFTPREVARIQSFPDSYKLVGSDNHIYRGLGNAIPPVVMWYLTKEILKLNSLDKKQKIKKAPELRSERQMELF